LNALARTDPLTMNTHASAWRIQHQAENQRFLVHVDGHDCVLDYQRNGAVITITHTGVADAVVGQGIAAALTRAALDWARRDQLKVVPQCSYAAVFIQRHPEYADLRD